MKRLLCLLMALMLLTAVLPVQAESTDPVAWTFGVELDDIRANYLILANADEPLEEGYEPTDLETIRQRHNDESGNVDNSGLYLATNTKVQLRKAALSAVGAMMAEAERDGVILYIRAGYRSYDDQTRRYNRAVQKGDTAGVQKPGECDFVTGLAVTLVGYAWRGAELEANAFASSAEAQWLKKNAARFGFVLRYPEGGESETGNAYEPWHYRYVGTGVAKYMAANNLTLEAFVRELNQAYADFAAAGGDLEAAMASTQLPEGAVELNTVGPDGDHEITLFHD